MKFPLLTPLILLVSGLSASTAAFAQTAPPDLPVAAPVTYQLDNTAGVVYVQVFKDPTSLAASLSHDHIIVARGWTGTVTWDPTNAAACKVEVSVPVSQLDNDAPDPRKMVGYDTVLDSDQRAQVKAHMLEEDQLNAAKYPTIQFKATRCDGTGSALKVTGDFTLRGVTHAITVPMTISADGSTVSAKGTFKINHTDYGFQPYTALLGQLKNKDEMRFTIDVKGKKI